MIKNRTYKGYKVDGDLTIGHDANVCGSLAVSKDAVFKGPVRINGILAADNVDCGVSFTCAIFKVFKSEAVFHCKAFVDTTHNFADGFRYVLTCLSTVFSYSFGEVAHYTKLGSIGVNEALEGLAGKSGFLKVIK